jgi:hypothetical protein
MLLMKNENIDLTQYLRAELTRRISKNPRYSLRAFAKSIKLSPGMLSLVLADKNKLSHKKASLVAQALGLLPSSIGSLNEKNGKLSNRNVTLDFFLVLSEWYHFAILSLLEVPDAKFNPRWIASRLGITQSEASLAIERLQSLELVSEVQPGQWRQSGGAIRVEDSVSNAAARKFQKQLLLKAIESLENDPQNERDVSSVVFAMNMKEFAYATKKITEFRRQLSDDLERRRPPNSVYQMTVQLVPLTKKTKELNKG